MPIITTDYSHDGKVANVILNRPNKMNALNFELLGKIEETLDAIAEEEEVRVTTIEGAGDHFSAGGDLDKLKEANENNDIEYTAEYTEQTHRAYEAIYSHPVPTLAIVDGYALAGGFEIVMSCDLAVGSEDASLGDQHLNFGLIPGGTGTQRYARLIGARRAKELILTGRYLSGEEAKEWGIFNEVVPGDELEDAAKELVDSIVEKSPNSTRLAKHLVNQTHETDLETGLEIEREITKRYLLSDDVAEGMAAFSEGRDPVF